MRRQSFPATGAFSCLAIFLAALLFVSPPVAAQSSEYSYARIVRLSLVEGDVQLARPGEKGWQTALANMPIQHGYVVASGQGRAEIEFESGATARIAENTTIEFTELALADGARITRLSLTQGAATFYANLSREDNFTVLTPHLSAAIPDNARFRLDVDRNGTFLRVLKGDIQVETQTAGSHRVTKGRSLFYRSGEADEVTIARNPEPDDWDRWVADRDEVVHTSRATSSRYVNAPFSYGLSDLSRHGLWAWDANYGFVWQPYGISSAWSPYWDGRWVFVHGIGWTWVSYEPWGWLPYHFGRWALTRIGWVWLPGHFSQWHPGLVLWAQFGNNVGWCPLGPGVSFGNPPVNTLPPGTVVNTTTGVMTGATNQRPGTLTGVHPRWTLDVPMRERGLDASEGGTPQSSGATGAATATGFSGASGGATLRGEPRSEGGAPTNVVAPPRLGTGQGGIVYDPTERRFVNDPAKPAAIEVERDRSEVRQPPAGTRGYAGGATPTPQTTRPMEPRAGEPGAPAVSNPGTYGGRDSGGPGRGTASGGRPGVPPQRPAGEMRGPAPRPTTPPSPPPRVETSRPAPPPRTDTPRPMPQPRIESPRPSSPPPAPMPRSEPREPVRPPRPPAQ